MIDRRIERTVAGRLRDSAAVVLLGPRQVGKTTLARAVAAKARRAVYLDLEDAADRRRLHDAGAFLRAQGSALVVLDEIHRAPEVFQTLRGVIDDHRRNNTSGRFCCSVPRHSTSCGRVNRSPGASATWRLPAVARYVDLLVDLLLVRRLHPWSGNVGKRLVRSPKTYVRDSGVLHALLEIETMHGLLGHPVVGASWEGFVIENLLAAAGDRYVPTFYRTTDGAEVDLVLERGGRVEHAIEIKRTTAPDVPRGFRLACDVLKPRATFIVHGGDEEWPMGSGIQATSLRKLMARLRRTR